jgi:hypothetical protein
MFLRVKYFVSCFLILFATQKFAANAGSLRFFSQRLSSDLTARKRLCTKSPKIPPTAVGGLLRSFLNNLQNTPHSNSTNGSWWILQVRTKVGLEQSTNCRWWYSKLNNEPSG